MSEEMNKREAELREAALEDVSGGDSFGLGMAVHAICLNCAKVGNCSHRAELLEYIRAHGTGSVPGASHCPFNDKA